MRLVFASNNAHKLAEVRAMMPAGVEVLSLKEIGFEQEIEENGATLEENSAIKARAVAAFISSQPSAISPQIDGVFADDTGLEIDSLDGSPGVYTARWYRQEPPLPLPEGKETNETAIFAANRAKALRELKGKADRGCQFRTVITLAIDNRCAKVDTAPLNRQATDVSANYIQVEGVVRGRIAEEEYGEGGFGYDPIFIPEGYDKTFGELAAEVKNQISHRARAIEELVKIIQA